MHLNPLHLCKVGLNCGSPTDADCAATIPVRKIKNAIGLFRAVNGAMD